MSRSSSTVSRYGDLFTVRPYGLGDIVVVADRARIKEVFTADRDVFAAGQANAAMTPCSVPTRC